MVRSSVTFQSYTIIAGRVGSRRRWYSRNWFCREGQMVYSSVKCVAMFTGLTTRLKLASNRHCCTFLTHADICCRIKRFLFGRLCTELNIVLSYASTDILNGVFAFSWGHRSCVTTSSVLRSD